MMLHCPCQSSLRDDVVIAASVIIMNIMPFCRPHFLSLFEKLTSSATYSFSSKPLTSSHAPRRQNRKAPPANPSFGDAQFQITDITLAAQPTLPSNFNNAPAPERKENPTPNIQRQLKILHLIHPKERDPRALPVKAGMGGWERKHIRAPA